MLSSPEYEAWNDSEEDAYVWLVARAQSGEPNIRQTDSIWPDSFWDLSDKVAEQGEVLPEDADRLSTLYDEWQTEMNEEDASSEDDS